VTKLTSTSIIFCASLANPDHSDIISDAYRLLSGNGSVKLDCATFFHTVIFAKATTKQRHDSQLRYAVKTAKRIVEIISPTDNCFILAHYYSNTQQLNSIIGLRLGLMLMCRRFGLSPFCRYSMWIISPVDLYSTNKLSILALCDDRLMFSTSIKSHNRVTLFSRSI